MNKIKSIILAIALLCIELSGIAVAANNFNTLDVPATVAITNCTSGAPIFYLNGVAGCSTTTSTITSCGVSPAITGTNFEGVVTAGSGVLTSCTLNFASTLSGIPRCVATGSTGAVWITSISTSTVVFAAVSLTSTKIYYSCWGAS